ncbi:MAG: hypothetical protein F9K25_16765 [Candidatus Contendobacter sp.]|nr:MAG: hypothetical protein F9K25_16765 [Candidatus Contendobacter sp.]
MTGVLGRKLGRTLLYGSLLAAGCSQQAWYEGFQAGARQQCAALRSPSAIQQCMDQVNSLSYPQYQREREGIPDEAH